MSALKQALVAGLLDWAGEQPGTPVVDDWLHEAEDIAEHLASWVEGRL